MNIFTENGMSALLLEIATKSAMLRVYEAIGFTDHENKDRWDRSHPYWKLNDEIAKKMDSMGLIFRNSGRDARTSAYWPLLEHKWFYNEQFERNRRVTVDILTPKSIHDCLDKGNTVQYISWKIEVGGCREVTGDYGEPAFESRIWVSNANDKTPVMFSGRSKQTARKIYKHIMGSQFDGVDTLGEDAPHPAEYCY